MKTYTKLLSLFIFLFAFSNIQILAHESNPEAKIYRDIARGRDKSAIHNLSHVNDIDSLRYNSRDYYLFGLIPSLKKASDHDMPVLLFAFDQRRHKVFDYLLLEREADISVKDFHDNNLLHYVSKDEYSRNVYPLKVLVVDFLRKDVAHPQNIDVNAKNDMGQTALHIAIVNYIEEYNRNDFFVEDIIRDLAGNRREDYMGLSFARHLVDAGADPSIKDDRGLTVFDVVDKEMLGKRKALRSFVKDDKKIIYKGERITQFEYIDLKLADEKEEIYRVLNLHK